jgi:hypothetical protein
VSAQLFELGAFRLVREKAKPLGDNVTVAMIRRVKQEQAAGRSGNGVLGELMDIRRRIRESEGFGPYGGGDAA